MMSYFRDCILKRRKDEETHDEIQFVKEKRRRKVSMSRL